MWPGTYTNFSFKLYLFQLLQKKGIQYLINKDVSYNLFCTVT